MRLDDNLIKGRKKVHSLSTLRAEVLFRIMHVKEELRERERERERDAILGREELGQKGILRCDQSSHACVKLFLILTILAVNPQIKGFVYLIIFHSFIWAMGHVQVSFVFCQLGGCSQRVFSLTRVGEDTFEMYLRYRYMRG